MGVLFYFLIALYAIGIGALGCGILMLFISMDRKKAIIIILMGSILIISTIIFNKFLPSNKKETTITVIDTALTSQKDRNGLYSCKVIDTYTLYQYFSDNQEEVLKFCSKFKSGEKYDIKYLYKSGIYTILEVK